MNIYKDTQISQVKKIKHQVYHKELVSSANEYEGVSENVELIDDSCINNFEIYYVINCK